MDGGEAADDGMIFDQDMSGQGGSIRQDDLISDLAVMGDMGVGHEVVAISDDGLSTPMRSASMEGHKLSNDILIAHQEGGLLPLIGKGLRGFSNRGRIERSDISFQSESLPG